MSVNDCISKSDMLSEQFIPDHVFLYICKGSITGYDGSQTYTLNQGDYCLVRKNRLARYYSDRSEGLERIFFCYDESFLRGFQERHKLSGGIFTQGDTFLNIRPNPIIPAFIESLTPYTDPSGKINEAFEDLKYEELLMILLQIQPELSGLLFDFAAPEKIDLEKFMNRNYRFNVNVGRFAYLTGRSLSAFKRDFKAIFNDTPNAWLIRKRLQDAYVLIGQQNKKASDIYLDLGFEDLSHFSFAFKRQFGLRPTELGANKRAH